MGAVGRLLCMLMLLAGIGCAGGGPVPEPEVAVQPAARPVHNLTSFSQALTCMDQLFLDHGVQNIVITSQGIPDATGEIRTGTKDMLISAVSRMSTRSNAFRFVDYDQRELDINALQNLVGFTQDFRVPNYYIRGAITQFDEQVVSKSASGGISFEPVDIGAAVNKVSSIVSIDLNMGDLLTRQILPGTSANNSIAVSRARASTDMNGEIEKADLGFSFNLNMNRSEGMHQAVRTLVELSAIETLGKLTEVPYWRCLGPGHTSTAMLEQARDWYDDMSIQDKRLFVQRALAGMGRYDGEITGDAITPELKDAIGAYQADSGLLADGRINFQLYASLIAEDLELGQRPVAEEIVRVSRPPNVQPLALSLSTGRDDRGFRVGDRLSITLQADDQAFSYCYYQDGSGQVFRLFPNRFQPDPLLAPGKPLTIPGVNSPFEIVMEQPGATEEVLCLASRTEVGINLPPALKGQDLTPLPVESLDSVHSAFQASGGSSGLVDRRLALKVAP